MEEKFYRKLPYNFAGGVIDTTGAGDSWITGFNFFLYRQYEKNGNFKEK